jgi:hypothetical protein
MPQGKKKISILGSPQDIPPDAAIETVIPEKKSLLRRIGSALVGPSPIGASAVGLDAAGNPVAVESQRTVPRILKYLPWTAPFVGQQAAQEQQRISLPLQAAAMQQKMEQEEAQTAASIMQARAAAQQADLARYKSGYDDKRGVGWALDLFKVPGKDALTTWGGTGDLTTDLMDFLQKQAESDPGIKEFQTSSEGRAAIGSAIEAAKAAGTTEPFFTMYNTAASKYTSQESSKARADFRYRGLLADQNLGKPVSAEDKAWMKAYETQTTLPTRTGAAIRIEGLGDIRGNVVTDTKTGITAPMSWNDYNKLSKAEPGRWISPQYDATIAEALAAARSMGREWAVGTEADQIQSFRTFIGHAGDLRDFSAKAGITSKPWANRPLNWLRRQTDDPEIQTYLAKIEPPRLELETFLMNNRALHDINMEVSEEIINDTISPRMLNAVLKSYVHTAKIRMDTLDLKYADSHEGKRHPTMFDPETKRILGSFGEAAKGSPVTLPPTRPANVPKDYIYKVSGPSGRGWYKP